MVPDKHGKLDDICLGFDDMAGIAGILTHRSVGQSVSRSVSHLVSRSVSQSVSQSVD